MCISIAKPLVCNLELNQRLKACKTSKSPASILDIRLLIADIFSVMIQTPFIFAVFNIANQSGTNTN